MILEILIYVNIGIFASAIQVVIGVRKIVKNGCQSPTKLGDGQSNKPDKNQSLLHPPTHTACPPPRVGLPLASALAIARTKAKDSLATASASRLDPTPAVTVGRLQPLRVFRNALCVPR